jgi:tetratricopeptide (TPR) repeat protein
MPLLVVAAGLLAYSNSFRGVFLFDDMGSITENPTIRHLWPIWRCLSPPRHGGLTVEGRPLINLSLAINYAIGGIQVWGYHVLNLTIHILAGLTLLGILRRTLHQPILRGRFGAAADELALAAAVLWTVHPLQTESVTYVIQRTESIMGLFYLLTMYCFIRGAESPPRGHGKGFMGNGSWRRPWYGLSVTACVLGMASKEVMVSAPLMVMLYDRAFLSGSFREAWRRRWQLYLGLASTWILLGFVVASGQLPATSINAQRHDLHWWAYLAIQPRVILDYLRLCVWPAPLALQHEWVTDNAWLSLVLPAIVIGVLVAASVWAWRRSPASSGTRQVWGFVGAWFFLILAPTSSVVPLLSPMYEHRMYLSLAAVVSLLVVGLYSLLGGRSRAVFALMAIALGFLTWRRNLDYRSEVIFWQDTTAESPHSAFAHYSLGVALGRAGRVREAIAEYREAVQLQPDYADAHNNLGVALAQVGAAQEAFEHYEQVLRMKPGNAEAHYNWGNALVRLGRLRDAIGHYEQAVRINPNFAKAHNNLGIALGEAGAVQEAIEQWQLAVRIQPDYAEAQYNWGNALVRLGRLQEAIGHYERALQISPDFAEAHNRLGVVLWKTERVQEAIGHWESALRVKPDYAEAHNNLGAALVKQGKLQDGIEHFREALRVNPNYAKAHYNLGSALEQQGRLKDAIGEYEQALRDDPDLAAARDDLARLQAAQ